MPSWEIFDKQPQAYRDLVLPRAVKARVAVEQASTFGWERKTNSFVADLLFDDDEEEAKA